MSFPFYKQLNLMDCGPTCIQIIAQFYGQYYSLQHLREICHVSREGVSLLGISDAAEKIGLRASCVRLTWEQLCNEVNLPCIIYWKEEHFIVVYKIKKYHGQTYIYVSDPAVGLLKYDEDSFLKFWICNFGAEIINQNDIADKGIALLLKPTAAFYKNEEHKKHHALNFRYILKYLYPHKGYLLQVVFAILTSGIIGLLLPFITQSVVDVGIGTKNIPFIVMLLVAQVLLTIGQTTNNLIRAWLMLHMTTRISISLISDFLYKLMRLPIAFFDSKMVGDIMQRIGDYNRIQTFLTGSLLSIIMSIITFIIYSFVMVEYNIIILGVFVSGSIIYIVIP